VEIKTPDGILEEINLMIQEEKKESKGSDFKDSEHQPPTSSKLYFFF
jgi:hypothetical protein